MRGCGVQVGTHLSADGPRWLLLCITDYWQTRPALDASNPSTAPQEDTRATVPRTTGGEVWPGRRDLGREKLAQWNWTQGDS